MKKLILLFAFLLFSVKTFATEIPNIPADIAVEKLKNGNARFTTYQMKHPNLSKTKRLQLAKGQHPYAVIITCSDSRTAPELIFDQGLGDLFVIRNAGNILDEHVLGSIQYAVLHLGVNLVVVMGHENCGAVGAAMKDNKEAPGIEAIKEAIKPAVDKCKMSDNQSYDNVIRENARLVAEEIALDKELAEHAKKHDFKVVPAYYSIDTGEVEFLK